jgi:hypothetical protein
LGLAWLILTSLRVSELRFDGCIRDRLFFAHTRIILRMSAIGHPNQESGTGKRRATFWAGVVRAGKKAQGGAGRRERARELNFLGFAGQTGLKYRYATATDQD